MISLRIDNSDIKVQAGATVLDAAGKAGIRIPTMCYLKGCENHPSCMVCVVKDNKTGAIIPSCASRATDGMDISTTGDEVMTARRQALELLMSDHVGDCEAPCSLACPAGMDIPHMNRLIGEGKFTEALNVVKEDIALPYVLGFICPAPCEKACRRKQVDDAVSVCLLKRFTAEAGKDEKAEACMNNTEKSGKKVAIIGSGPAGLAAAYYLLLKGHSCTIFEKSQEAGGTLRYSIPDDELPKYVIDNETDILKAMGGEFKTGMLITKQEFKSLIQPNFDAVILATGEKTGSDNFEGVFESTKTGYQVNEHDMGASVKGVFVCGSAIRPHKMAVRSVAQGKNAAGAAHNYLLGKEYSRPGKMFNSRFDKLLPEEYGEYLKEATSSGRSEPVGGYLKGFTAAGAIMEAMRCMHCDCRKKDECKLRNYSDEYGVDRKRYIISGRKAMTKHVQHELVIFEPEKCIKCGLCIEISARNGEKYGMAFEGRGFDVSVNAPLGSGLRKGLSHTADKCVRACPTAALSFRSNIKHVFRVDKNKK